MDRDKRQSIINELSVLRFSSEMIGKLHQNNHKSSWRTELDSYLFVRLLEEVVELFKALNTLDKEKNMEKVISECCDVANFAMFIADKRMVEFTRKDSYEKNGDHRSPENDTGSLSEGQVSSDP